MPLLDVDINKMVGFPWKQQPKINLQVIFSLDNLFNYSGILCLVQHSMNTYRHMHLCMHASVEDFWV